MLFDIVVRVIVSILITDSFAKLFVAAVVGVLKMNRHSGSCFFTESMAAAIAFTAELLFGAQAYRQQPERE